MENDVELKTPKSLRLHIGVFGRTNVGKSTLVNYISDQDTSIVSSVAGTTTDSVYKSMELSPLGPITLIDTAGIDDISDLSKERIERTAKVFDSTDVAIIVLEQNIWTKYENEIVKQLNDKKTPFLFVINNYKKESLDEDFIKKLSSYKFIETELLQDKNYREQFLASLKQNLLSVIPEDSLNLQPLTQNIIKSFQTVVMVVPLDLGAPKGRLILPQVQMIRACLDINAVVIITKETELKQTLEKLKDKPDIVICDSQVVKKVLNIIPEDVAFTTFSIIFSSNKSDFKTMLEGIKAIKNLKPADKVLIAEACSHHASKDDIGRVKIPKLLSKYLGFELRFDVSSGIDYPKNLEDYSLIIHCGGCMINKKQMISRLNYAVNKNIPITNYGMVISFVNNTLDRVIQPFVKNI
ncbi:[FeFe] hydrogenase H-cluster maturation GTPase HydF [Candidatus Ruminimicrobiellum ovillum]|uniref:[FeFe] hydrogenase H-cluster maturation GTPase HydF n=1 Tax=Candidatus Ruminimicrobiellum ovillum TaxID=1947927 RepID=UPI00355A542C